MSPHTQEQVITDKWDRPYSRELAAFPAVRILSQILIIIIIISIARKGIYFNKGKNVFFMCISAFREGKHKDVAHRWKNR